MPGSQNATVQKERPRPGKCTKKGRRRSSLWKGGPSSAGSGKPGKGSSLHLTKTEKPQFVKRADQTKGEFLRLKHIIPGKTELGLASVRGGRGAKVERGGLKKKGRKRKGWKIRLTEALKK